MSDNYILDASHNVIKTDFMTWAVWYESNDRIVKVTMIDNIKISTVFLGLDHNFYQQGPPLFFETMIFGEGEFDEYQERCSTWDRAVEQHERAVNMVSAAVAPKP